ncbi:M48 family metallopeptidase [Marinivivus vitaminiproducens]|uniref:M48 family metallopeptidase n=1 Tax=Marinivivus vitaminiproducens TaxID=3035935 RepID=UPI0027994D2D|nr:SprT family zinc-dependent metalloprotease [Geminicoccaceae bacterium SCSIO 64248]
MPTSPERMPGRVALGGRLIDCAIRWSGRRRTIGLRIGPDGLTVAAPIGVRPEAVVRVLKAKSAWILKHLDRTAEHAADAARSPADGDPVFFRGRPLVLGLSTDPLRVRPTIRQEGDRLDIVLGRQAAGADPAACRDVIRSWGMKRAYDLLAPRVRHFAALLDGRLRAVRIGNQRSRWGSCDASGIVRLNWRLVQLPEDLADYVAAHEAAHLRQMNHGPAFWALVEGIMPDWRERRVRLRSDARRFVLP